MSDDHLKFILFTLLLIIAFLLGYMANDFIDFRNGVNNEIW